jgi:hypothetical protein
MEETAVEFPSHCGNFTLRGTLSRGRGHCGRDGVCLLLHGGMVRVCVGCSIIIIIIIIIIMDSIHTENVCMSSMQPWQNSTQCVMNKERSWTTVQPPRPPVVEFTRMAASRVSRGWQAMLLITASSSQ